MTEEEAKTKVCPVGTLRSTCDGNWDRGPCIASACMWWRWDSGYRTYLDEQNGDLSHSTVNGHCGLAGKP